MAASLFTHSGIDSRKMFKEHPHDGKSVCNSVCKLWLCRGNIRCINIDVAMLNHGLLSTRNKKVAMRRMVHALSSSDMLCVAVRLYDHTFLRFQA